LLPNHIITHAPQGPYFKQDHYKNGGYITVDKAVGAGIDFYNIQFYNQGDTKYDTYQSLFIQSGGYFSGTSVKEIMSRGISSKKLVVGKPVNPADASNTGWMDHNTLGQATSKAYSDLGWYAGVMFWQYPSDLNGDAISKSAGHLKEMCAQNKNCK
jgi:chitinase